MEEDNIEATKRTSSNTEGTVAGRPEVGGFDNTNEYEGSVTSSSGTRTDVAGPGKTERGTVSSEDSVRNVNTETVETRANNPHADLFLPFQWNLFGNPTQYPPECYYDSSESEHDAHSDGSGTMDSVEGDFTKPFIFLDGGLRKFPQGITEKYQNIVDWMAGNRKFQDDNINYAETTPDTAASHDTYKSAEKHSLNNEAVIEELEDIKGKLPEMQQMLSSISAILSGSSQENNTKQNDNMENSTKNGKEVAKKKKKGGKIRNFFRRIFTCGMKQEVED